MKRLTVMVERDEDALAIVQLLMQGANKAIDFRLETINNGASEPAPKRKRSSRENSGAVRCWQSVKELTAEFTVKDVEPIALANELSASSAASMVSRWRSEGLIVWTGMRGRIATYVVKH